MIGRAGLFILCCFCLVNQPLKGAFRLVKKQSSREGWRTGIVLFYLFLSFCVAFCCFFPYQYGHYVLRVLREMGKRVCEYCFTV
ncbi:hypothetical protein BDZ91DRAFT_737378 [Kalaharituber pfeilii]|nr:hypothetical protein BDZ91DRAFT_737378 [Kalaharituber pfeilii]